MEQLQAQGADVTFVAMPNLSHQAMVQFVPALQEAVPWLEQHWQQPELLR